MHNILHNNSVIANITPQQIEALIQLLPLVNLQHKKAKPVKAKNNYRRQIEDAWKKKYPFS